MKVLKFGGTSVKNTENILKVKKIVESENRKKIVVVSALGGVTDQLLKTSKLASQGDKAYKEEFSQIRDRHLELVDELIFSSKLEAIKKQVKDLLAELSDFLRGLYIIREITPRMQDNILSYGERLSAYIISKVIGNACFADAREFIKTDSNFGNAKVDFAESTPLIQRYFKDIGQTPIVPGFIASDENGDTTTIGRGGSDFTASIIASALYALKLEIWTDVSGFMTADPSMVEKAYPIKRLSYEEAMELSHFGAKVIYTPTIQPVFKSKIPITIKNTFDPNDSGSIISSKEHALSNQAIKGISSINEISLITLQGPGMMGISGIAKRLFAALAHVGINVILISQASSEHSISFAISPRQVNQAKAAIDEAFEVEITIKKTIEIKIETDLACIAIVGENMKNTPGIAGKLFESLGKNGINIIAIAQGSSELNISTVVAKNSLKKALNVIHEGFFLSDYVELNLYQVGIGTVGGNLLEQIKNQQEYLLRDHKLKINVVGIASLNGIIVDPNGIDLENYKTLIEKTEEKADLNKFVEKIKELNLRNGVFIDCTASKDVSDHYLNVLNSYVSVVAANKIANSSDYEAYREIREVCKQRNVKFLYETNVGAGLPIIRTIADLLRSGDEIIRLEAVLSGTLNYIFNVLSQEVPLSKAIKMAQEKGYSEPDPRIDLSGVDVLRKLLILARESGYPIEKEDINVKHFLPKSCMETNSVEEFYAEVEKFDAEFEVKRKKLESENKKWRYTAVLENGTPSIELMEVGSDHPLYNLAGSDNIILLTTKHYFELPMIIKGAGAGAAVTATGVFADIIRIANI